MEFSKFIEWGFLGLISSAMALAVSHLKIISNSIAKLNIQVGEILVHSAYHKEELEKHEVRITKLEEKHARR